MSTSLAAPNPRWPTRPRSLSAIGGSGARTASALLIGLVLALATWLAGMPRAEAATMGAPTLVTPGEMRSGSLLFRHQQGDAYAEAPRLGTDVDITVSGPTARARITQIFHNPTDGWVEAVYVYPLPDGSAVDTLKMVIGDRIVIGELKERQKAKEIYERAKAAGQKATLLEQERPNLFTNSVANIGPGEAVLVQIEYQEPVRQSGDVYSLRVPLVVAPRYSPKPIVQTVDFGSQGGWGSTAMDPVPDRDRITPPVLDPREHAPTNPVQITVRLQAGFPLADVKSHHHAIKAEATGDDARVIKLAEGPVPADRDFELTWQPVPGRTPSAGLFREQVGNAEYLLAFVTPPVLQQAEDARPREIVFVIDNSGSMGGTSMKQAKASLVFGLSRLKPTDRFNVIRFDDTMDVLFTDAVPADAENVRQAQRFVAGLEARGGTNMVPAMEAALTDTQPGDSTYLRQVVFLTDGEIGNEQQLFEAISSRRGRSRVFMVGIGSAPNSFLMTRASEIGRGTFTHIGSADQVEGRMRGLFEKLESPAVTGLSIAFPDAEVDATPAILPDLYRGEPLVLSAKLASLAGSVEIKGMIGGQPWVVRMPLAGAAEGKGLSKLWARRKIADAEVERTLGKLDMDQTNARILSLALEHGLVTRLTSLVAVDKTPSRPNGQRLSRADIPLNLPAGWDFDKVFGERASASKPTAGDRDQSAPILEKTSGRRVANAIVGQAQEPQANMSLPQTATDAELRLVVGLLVCALSLLLLAFHRRRVLGV